MFISLRSIKNFIVINSTLLFTGLIQHFIKTESDSLIVNYISTVAKNYFLINIIDNSIKNKEIISKNIPKENYKYEFHYNLLSASVIETFTNIYIQSYFVEHSDLLNLLLFIPKSFIFEITFDFFHYWAHLISHMNKYLYQYSHKHHHMYNNVNSYITYYHSPIDLLITNTIPQILTLLIVPSFTSLEYEIMKIYLTYGEIGGHNGHHTSPTSCFCQFIWLPRILNIELYSEDHYLHHSLNNCNYSKRFSLWDKLFDTYKTIIKKNQ